MDNALIIDAGNTNIKLAIFQEGNLTLNQRIEGNDLKKLQSIIEKHHISQTLLASVRNENETKELKKLLPNCDLISDLNIPLKIEYENKQTLGSDRIANAVAIASKTKGNKLAIDIGTCIKFDFVDRNNIYLGGSISPGITLRYKAMNDYTGALPLLNETSQIEIIGKNTITCMHSGVINGIKGELDYFIQQYDLNYPDLTIFMTGGDAKYFDYSSKKNIFALENLTLEGLYLILKTNAK
jgi:type III pantothenate kinase